jgi:hypothetical protein
VNYAETHAEVQRLRAERKRFEIEQLIVDLRLYDCPSEGELYFDLDINQAVERVRKFLEERIL